MYFVTNVFDGIQIAGPFPYHDEAEDHIRKNKYPVDWSVTGVDYPSGYSYPSTLLQQKDKEAERKWEQEKRDFENRRYRAVRASQSGIIVWARN